jgi:hypothetical protein
MLIAKIPRLDYNDDILPTNVLAVGLWAVAAGSSLGLD